MNNKKLRELEEHHKYLSDGGSMNINRLIKYVRQLEKEKHNPYFRVNTDGSVEKMECFGCKELLSLITTEKVDGSTLVECLNVARRILINHDYIELSEDLSAWVEKLEAVGGKG